MFSCKKKYSNLLAFREEEFSALSSKNKVAEEKKMVKRGKFETFKDFKLSLWMFKFFKNACQNDMNHT